jgi:hypothetical protein
VAWWFVVDLAAITDDPDDQLTTSCELDGAGTITWRAANQLACTGCGWG